MKQNVTDFCQNRTAVALDISSDSTKIYVLHSLLWENTYKQLITDQFISSAWGEQPWAFTEQFHNAQEGFSAVWIWVCCLKTLTKQHQRTRKDVPNWTHTAPWPCKRCTSEDAKSFCKPPPPRHLPISLKITAQLLSHSFIPLPTYKVAHWTNSSQPPSLFLSSVSLPQHLGCKAAKRSKTPVR